MYHLLFSSLLTVLLNAPFFIQQAYCAPVTSIDGYQATIGSFRTTVRQSQLSEGFKQEIEALLDIFLNNLQGDSESDHTVDVAKTASATLQKRNSDLQKNSPQLFQKFMELDDAGQWFLSCITSIATITASLETDKFAFLTKLVKVIRNVTQKSTLPEKIKQQRQEFLTVFETKMAAANQDLNLSQHTKDTFADMRKIWQKNHPEIIEIADATQVFVEFISQLGQLPSSEKK